jgi:hypothetical protein
MDEQQTSTLTTMKDLFGNWSVPIPKNEKQKRGELISYFAQKTGRTEGYIRFKLTGMMDLDTLYFLRSDCDQAAARGVPWGAAFHTAIKPKEV